MNKHSNPAESKGFLNNNVEKRLHSSDTMVDILCNPIFTHAGVIAVYAING